MKRPVPSPGLVVRYDYLWRSEARSGRLDGAKDRPCAVIIAYDQDERGNQTAILAAITHSPPKNSDDAIEVPARVKRSLGLDQARSWIVMTEINRVDWRDPGITPAMQLQWEYGRLPMKLWQPLRDEIVARSKMGKVGVVDRIAIENRSARGHEVGGS